MNHLRSPTRQEKPYAPFDDLRRPTMKSWRGWMQLRRSRVFLWGACISLLLAPAAYWAANHFWPHIDDRVYVIGWQDVPPFQQKAADGSPAGLAVDLVGDAARRRGIRLRWQWYPGSAEAALRNRQVDLWPLITIT